LFFRGKRPNLLQREQNTDVNEGGFMSLTSTLLYCPECGCQQIEAHKSYPVKAGGVRQLYYCSECKGYFSETHNTPLANLKTPLSRIIEILQALNEGLGVNAVCRVFGVSKSSLYRWQQRLSDLKPTLVLYALCHQFLNLVIEGDELYTKVKKPFPRGRAGVDYRTVGASVAFYLGTPLWA
jgi:transposase-like protein